MAQGAIGLHFKGLGHGGPARGVLAGYAAEGMEVGAEHKVIALARSTLRRRRAPSIQAPLVTQPLSAAVRLFSYLFCFLNIRRYIAITIVRVSVSWMCQPHGKGCRPSGVATG